MPADDEHQLRRRVPLDRQCSATNDQVQLSRLNGPGRLDERTHREQRSSVQRVQLLESSSGPAGTKPGDGVG